MVNNRLNDTERTREKQGDAAAKTNENTGSVTKSSDKVTLTDASSQVKNLEAKAAASNIDNNARIESIKIAIKEGNYEINAENIAKNIIQTERLIAG